MAVFNQVGIAKTKAGADKIVAKWKRKGKRTRIQKLEDPRLGKIYGVYADTLKAVWGKHYTIDLRTE